MYIYTFFKLQEISDPRRSQFRKKWRKTEKKRRNGCKELEIRVWDNVVIIHRKESHLYVSFATDRGENCPVARHLSILWYVKFVECVLIILRERNGARKKAQGDAVTTRDAKIDCIFYIGTRHRAQSTCVACVVAHALLNLAAIFRTIYTLSIGSFIRHCTCAFCTRKRERERKF